MLSMNDPDRFLRWNQVLRSDEEKVIKEFIGVIQRRPDGRDSLIDLGCGPGDVLMDLVRPLLPDTYDVIVGTDISSNMIECARRRYADQKRVEFKVLDAGSDYLPWEYRGRFDHVTSFHCLHWIRNQKQVLRNVYDMLTDGGDCLLVFLASHTIFDAYEFVARDAKWKKYMPDIKKIIPISQTIPDPWLFYTKLFTEVGFVDQNIEVRQKVLVYDGVESLREHLISVNPFVERMPMDEREQYADELCKFYKMKGWCDHGRYIKPQKLVVAYARKKLG